MTPEEKLAEKLRAQQLQEESDLELAKETFGIVDSQVDTINPTSKEEFVELASAISKKVLNYSAGAEYPAFVEDLFRNICVSCKYIFLRPIFALMPLRRLKLSRYLVWRLPYQKSFSIFRTLVAVFHFDITSFSLILCGNMKIDPVNSLAKHSQN